jgi:hypothetical protein
MSGTSRERWRHISPPPPRKIKIAKCKLGPWHNVADIFSAPLNRRMNVECIMHLTLVELLHLRRHHQLFGYIHSPQMTSRYVIFGQLF